MDSEKILDLEYLLDMSGGDYDFVVEVLDTFTESAPCLISELNAALLEGNGIAATRAAHTLKGSSRSIGAEPFAILCQQIENAARGENFIECKQMADRLPKAYQSLLIEIAKAGQQQKAA